MQNTVFLIKGVHSIAKKNICDLYVKNLAFERFLLIDIIVRNLLIPLMSKLHFTENTAINFISIPTRSFVKNIF